MSLHSIIRDRIMTLFFNDKNEKSECCRKHNRYIISLTRSRSGYRASLQGYCTLYHESSAKHGKAIDQYSANNPL